jgi:hypothetical protein
MANQFLEKRVQKFTYDVTGGDSGAIGTHTLGTLPENAVITQAWISEHLKLKTMYK